MFVFILYLEMALVTVFVIYMVFARTRYKNRANAGAFFFESGSLVLNTGLPYPVPFEEIDYVELKYSARELESRLSYGLWVKVVKKSGKKKSVFYKGYRTAKLALPSDMAAALEERGIRCVMLAQ